MLVSELFTKLSFGPLSNLALANEGNGEIVEGSQGKIISHTNDALLRIYSRFVLREKEVIIEITPGRTNYHLLKRFAQTRTITSDEPIYVLDALNPFEEDVIKILKVVNDRGMELVLNDESDTYSLFTPYPTTLQIPRVGRGGVLSILYQAQHKKLEYGILSQNILIPETLEEALISYIAAKVYSNMNGQENTVKGQELMGMFDKVCQEVEEKDLVSSSPSNSNTKFRMRGFV